MTLTEISEQLDRAVLLLSICDDGLDPSSHVACDIRDALPRLKVAALRFREMVPTLQNLAVDHAIRKVKR